MMKRKQTKIRTKDYGALEADERLVVVAMNGIEAAAVFRILRQSRLPAGLEPLMKVLCGLFQGYLVVGGRMKRKC